ncbi:hypothetical protein [Aestuariicoccus sp. MJ-SS9]|uniref:hypothetical protein n=1 Tax=Aestuariicoccus sp. MJ-SS9 TaxID=3079855 RepID=UPI0029108AA4|nr:hypothetical protein [Aestuariicoccus sp. MJ-SS9]MDU8913772.1 hypothetical protein [Aestuariicoccus sp. MJ-SS9]
MRLLREPARLSDVSKYSFVYFVFSAIATLVISTIGEYVGYTLSDGYAYMDEFPATQPVALEWIDRVVNGALPVSLMAAFVWLLFLSTGRSLRIAACFGFALAVHIVALVPVMNALWLQILMLNQSGSV